MLLSFTVVPSIKRPYLPEVGEEVRLKFAPVWSTNTKESPPVINIEISPVLVKSFKINTPEKPLPPPNKPVTAPSAKANELAVLESPVTSTLPAKIAVPTA